MNFAAAICCFLLLASAAGGTAGKIARTAKRTRTSFRDKLTVRNQRLMRAANRILEQTKKINGEIAEIKVSIPNFPNEKGILAKADDIQRLRKTGLETADQLRRKHKDKISELDQAYKISVESMGPAGKAYWNYKTRKNELENAIGEWKSRVDKLQRQGSQPGYSRKIETLRSSLDEAEQTLRRFVEDHREIEVWAEAQRRTLETLFSDHNERFFGEATPIQDGYENLVDALRATEARLLKEARDLLVAVAQGEGLELMNPSSFLVDAWRISDFDATDHVKNKITRANRLADEIDKWLSYARKRSLAAWEYDLLDETITTYKKLKITQRSRSEIMRKHKRQLSLAELLRQLGQSFQTTAFAVPKLSADF